MATYLLAYFGYQEWKNSETPDDDTAGEKVTVQSSNKCESILNILRQVNKKLLVIVFILLTVILLLMIIRRFIKIRKCRRERNLRRPDKDYDSNC